MYLYILSSGRVRLVTVSNVEKTTAFSHDVVASTEHGQRVAAAAAAEDSNGVMMAYTTLV